MVVSLLGRPKANLCKLQLSPSQSKDTQRQEIETLKFSATSCLIRASNQRTPRPTTRLLSMAPPNKKNQRRALSIPSAALLSKNIQGGGPPDSGAVASAKAVQNVIPKAVKGIHAGAGDQGNVHATEPPTSNVVYPANNRYGVFSPRKIRSYLAWIALLAYRTLKAWVSCLVYRVLLVRKFLLIALILGLFASVAVSIHCTNQYPQLSSQLEKYIRTNWNSSAQLDASAPLYQDLEEQTLGLNNKIASMRDIFRVKERTQINWLSPLLGATIAQELCSAPSTFKEFKFDYSNLEKPENLPNQETNKSNFPNNSGPSVPGAAAALSPRKEVERRYCVTKGQVLQLGVSSPRSILPTSLIIEHWRMGEAPGSLMRRAPKDVELWTYIRAEDDAAKVKDEALTNYPDLANSSQQNEGLHPKQILNFPWIPIGVFRYEIDTNRDVQEFRIGYYLEVPMQHFAIRVISNWGHVGETCLVRVRLYGEVVDTTKIVHEDHVKKKLRIW